MRTVTIRALVNTTLASVTCCLLCSTVSGSIVYLGKRVFSGQTVNLLPLSMFRISCDLTFRLPSGKTLRKFLYLKSATHRQILRVTFQANAEFKWYMNVV